MPSNYVRLLHSRLFLTIVQTYCSLVHRVQERLISTKSARYYTSAEIAQKMMDTWSDASRSEKEVIDHFSSFDLLVIDEYGLHDRHEKRLEMVHKVLYSRYDNMKSTLLISNFTVQNMQRDLGVRLWSRLHENNLIVVPCYWDDRRITG